MVTRRDLLEVSRTGHGGRLVADLVLDESVTLFADQTLSEVAYEFAHHGVDRAPVVDRNDPHRLVGLITLSRLLEGRLRDLQEDRVRERPLSLRPRSRDGAPA